MLTITRLIKEPSHDESDAHNGRRADHRRRDLSGDRECRRAGVGKAIETAACAALPTHAQLHAALTAARDQKNGGFDLDMWGTVVNRDGVVCAVAFTGANRGSQWPGSRVISAQKANTANAFSLPQLALSTANLFSAVQPGGSLFGLQASNPVNTHVAYRGESKNYGQPDDPMTGGKIGGVNVFGGGLALYNANHELIGGSRRERRFLLCRPQHLLADAAYSRCSISCRLSVGPG
jgi:hypothetical protein